MLTIEWQPLSTRHGYEIPEAVEEAGLATVRRRDGTFGRAATTRCSIRSPSRLRTRCRSRTGIRFAMQFNAREAMHMLELRTAPSGHPSYRQIGQEMHRLIAEQAGHRAIADAMSYVDHTTYELERLAAERAAEARRTPAAPDHTLLRPRVHTECDAAAGGRRKKFTAP